VFHRYRPETIEMLRICLGGCPDDMEVEVKPGVPLVAKTIADPMTVGSSFFGVLTAFKSAAFALICPCNLRTLGLPTRCYERISLHILPLILIEANFAPLN
jgi:hypothetical protein